MRSRSPEKIHEKADILWSAANLRKRGSMVYLILIDDGVQKADILWSAPKGHYRATQLLGSGERDGRNGHSYMVSMKWLL
jgi:hypothetical protein